MTEPDTVPFVAQVVWSPDLLGYDFGHGHPMSPTRLDLTMRLVRALGLLDVPGVEVVGTAPASDEVLGLVHDPAYVAAVHAASDDGVENPALDRKSVV